MATGPRLAEAGAAIGPCQPGDAMAAPAFDLDPQVRHIIHTVGPFWEGGSNGESEILASCYRRSLQVADDLGARSAASQHATCLQPRSTPGASLLLLDFQVVHAAGVAGQDQGGGVASCPESSAAAWSRKPAVIARIPPNHTGLRSRLLMSRQLRFSRPGTCRFAFRCSTEDVALAHAPSTART